MARLTVEEITKLAETQWEGCHGCDDNDKNFWMNGFITGYLHARIDGIDNQIERNHNKIADVLINNTTINNA
jgi:hypothetical protein